MTYEDEIGGRRGSAWDGVIDTRCPMCHAEPGVKCVNPITGRPRHTPCLARSCPSQVPPKEIP